MSDANQFKFRFCIKFVGVPYYIGNREYDTRRECIDECLSLIDHIKETNPALAAAYCGWTYHGHLAGEPEPAWSWE